MFVIAKVHENNGKTIIHNGTEMPDVVFEDMAGFVRSASVWPPLCYEEGLWDVGKVVSILVLATRRKFNSFTVMSGCVVRLNLDIVVKAFPEECVVASWPTY